MPFPLLPARRHQPRTISRLNADLCSAPDGSTHQRPHAEPQRETQHGIIKDSQPQCDSHGRPNQATDPQRLVHSPLPAKQHTPLPTGAQPL